MLREGVVINVHYHGATVRLDDGTLAAVPALELAAHRAAFARSLERRSALPLVLERKGRHAIAHLAPPDAPGASDHNFEERMNAYLKSTEEWAPPDRPAPAERHFIRKKRRAAHFEARGKGV